MGKKKDKLAAKAQQAPAEQIVAADEVEPAKKKKKKAPEVLLEDKAPPKPSAEGAAAVPEPEGECEHPEDVYATAAVVFFTRDTPDGAVGKVLMAVEERKVQASYIGLQQKGKIVQRMLLFPMGRREKKDKNDTVETAKREYIEETGDYGGLSKYLDFADFDGDAEAEQQPVGSPTWTGRKNMALFFSPASMITLFCEVPAEAAKATHHAAVAGKPILPEGEEAEDKTEEQADGKKKKRKQNEDMKPSPSYHVGQTDHLEPRWVDASVLRAAMSSGERSPALKVGGEESRIFPTAASVLRLPEARKWLGLS